MEKTKFTTIEKIALTKTNDVIVAAKRAMFEMSAEETQSLLKTNAKEPRCKNGCF